MHRYPQGDLEALTRRINRDAASPCTLSTEPLATVDWWANRVLLRPGGIGRWTPRDEERRMIANLDAISMTPYAHC